MVVSTGDYHQLPISFNQPIFKPIPPIPPIRPIFPILLNVKALSGVLVPVIVTVNR